VHLTLPGNPTGATRFLTDLITKDYAPQKKAIGGDEFLNNRWERPFTADTMDYLADTDITRGELKVESPWIYITIFVADSRPAGVGQTVYGAELDTDRDGRGDYLVWGVSPAGTAWTTDGVEVWKDSNNDVGGIRPQISDATADAGWLLGDGYDQNLVKNGQGADPDLAWIRPLDGGKRIQLAFKNTAIGGATSFLWSVLADAGVRNPAWFDYNDRFTQAEAGSPLPIQKTLYPVKQIFGLDNSCRDAYGFVPIGTEANLCAYNGTIGGVAWTDGRCANSSSTYNNGVIDTGEPRYPGLSIHLGQGACPSAGYRNATTNADGGYYFDTVPAGTYCVSADGASLTTAAAVTVVLNANEHKTVNFGVQFYIGGCIK
jgi:hypothetical protein